MCISWRQHQYNSVPWGELLDLRTRERYRTITEEQRRRLADLEARAALLNRPERQLF